MNTSLKPIPLTIGDPLGIGPEIVAKLLRQSLWSNAPLVILGDIDSLTTTAESLGLSLPKTIGEHAVEYVSSRLNHAGPGAIASRAIEMAVEGIHQGDYSALVTGPINKARLHADGIRYDGHTEMLQDLANRYWKPPEGGLWQSDMLFAYNDFRLLLLTRHVPLAQVGQILQRVTVVQSLTTLVTFLRQQVGIEQPRIAIMGVNPHAGEIGGIEEADILIPVITEVNQTLNVSIGAPVAADGLFRGFDATQPAYDAYVAAYHDQGLIPFKLVAGLQAVNITIGLPFLRTSVSHGTADAIVDKGIADPQSLVAALDYAWKLSSYTSCLS